MRALWAVGLLGVWACAGSTPAPEGDETDAEVVDTGALPAPQGRVILRAGGASTALTAALPELVSWVGHPPEVRVEAPLADGAWTVHAAAEGEALQVTGAGAGGAVELSLPARDVPGGFDLRVEGDDVVALGRWEVLPLAEGAALQLPGQVLPDGAVDHAGLEGMVDAAGAALGAVAPTPAPTVVTGQRLAGQREWVRVVVRDGAGAPAPYHPVRVETEDPAVVTFVVGEDRPSAWAGQTDAFGALWVEVEHLAPGAAQLAVTSEVDQRTFVAPEPLRTVAPAGGQAAGVITLVSDATTGLPLNPGLARDVPVLPFDHAVELQLATSGKVPPDARVGWWVNGALVAVKAIDAAGVATFDLGMRDVRGPGQDRLCVFVLAGVVTGTGLDVTGVGQADVRRVCWAPLKEIPILGYDFRPGGPHADWPAMIDEVNRMYTGTAIRFVLEAGQPVHRTESLWHRLELQVVPGTPFLWVGHSGSLVRWVDDSPRGAFGGVPGKLTVMRGVFLVSSNPARVTLGRAIAPSKLLRALGWTPDFDDAGRWSGVLALADEPGVGAQTLAHEIGHMLGLPHDRVDATALMAETVSTSFNLDAPEVKVLRACACAMLEGP